MIPSTQDRIDAYKSFDIASAVWGAAFALASVTFAGAIALLWWVL